MSATCTQQAFSATQTKAFGSRPATRSARPMRVAVTVRAQADEFAVTRRQAAAAGAFALAAVLSASPAQAGLFGDGGEQKYVDDTVAVVGATNAVLALALDDATYDDKVKAVRTDINDWVANYRRQKAFSGRPSFGNVYSALNALAGHYNNFGTNAPIPRKRLERIEKELNDGLQLVQRGR